MKINLPVYVEKTIGKLEVAGFEAYAVGGCVRDSLLSHTPRDWDITTNATPDETKAVFPDCHVLETGVKHGTVTVILCDESVEITTYRVDGKYSDHRRPDHVHFTEKLEADLARRDFTINAMAYNPRCGIIDCFGGIADLKNHRIACVGNAGSRFSEDALRILRAVRFAATLNFSVAHETEAALYECAYLLDGISAERIASELCKLLTGRNAAGVLRQYTAVFTQIIPELKALIGFDQHTVYHHLDCWLHTVESVSATPADLVLRLTMLFHDIGKPKCFTADDQGCGHFYGHAAISAKMAAEILRRLKFDNATSSEIVYLVKHHGDAVEPDAGYLKRMLNKMGEERLRRLLMVKHADCAAQADGFRAERNRELDLVEGVLNRIIAEKQAFSLKALAVTGKDLLAIGYEEGPIIGETLQTLLELVIGGRLPNDRNILLASAENRKILGE